MKSNTYRDMHLLNEVTQTPDVTQRELSKRIGVALGLTNLMLRRLVKKGYIKISGTKRSRIRYLITTKGMFEKSRLTLEFVKYSLHLYGSVRHSLREQLAVLAQSGQRRILLYGTGELAEIAFLTIREMGLDLIGVVDVSTQHDNFLGYHVKDVRDIAAENYDCIVVTLLHKAPEVVQKLIVCGVPEDRIRTLARGGREDITSESHELFEVPSNISAFG